MTYGLLAVFVVMVADSACLPVPSELTMLSATGTDAAAPTTYTAVAL